MAEQNDANKAEVKQEEALSADTFEATMNEVLTSKRILLHLLPFCSDKPGLRTISKFWSSTFSESKIFWARVNGRSRRTNDTTVAQLATGRGALISYFDLANCKQIGDNSIKAIATNCTNLTGLDVTRCVKLSDASIVDLVTASEKLQHLILNFCTKLSDAAVHAASKCPNLETINVDWCPNITDESLIAVAENCPELKTFSAVNCLKVTEDPVLKLAENCKAVANNCPNLVSLEIVSCTRITDRSMRLIAENCPKIISLNVSSCAHLTDSSMQLIAQNLSQLSFLRTHGCTGLGPNCGRLLTDFARSSPGLRCQEYNSVYSLDKRGFVPYALQEYNKKYASKKKGQQSNKKRAKLSS